MPAPPLSRPLTLSGIAPGDRASFTSNVQAVTGKVSDSHAQVSVNGQAAAVDSQGHFAAYLDLPPGESDVEIEAVRGAETATYTITVSFDPPFAVWLDRLTFEPGKDYMKEPLSITGLVSGPKMGVEVNGIQASVAGDGTFSVAVPLHFNSSGIASVRAVADFWDSDVFDRQVWWRPGNDYPFMESPYRFQPYWPGVTSPGNLILRRGDDITVELFFNSGKYKRETILENWRINNLTANPGMESLPPGLKLTLLPSRFTVYPNCTYTIRLRIEVGPNTPAGNYFFSLDGDSYSFGLPAMSLIQINIQP
jgi:hypothetical protein